MTMNSYQKQVYDNIAKATSITTAASSIQVEQTPTFLKEPMKIADFAVGTIAALGAVTAELAEARGLPSQKIAVDRRHALLTLNDGLMHYMNGVLIMGGEIMVPVNGFYETKDGKWACFNGAYPHLRDGILKYFDAPHDQDALIKQVKKHNLDKILTDFEALGLCAAPVLTCEEFMAHPQGKAMSALPPVIVKRLGDAEPKILPTPKHRPLEGVRIIDVTHVIAGPWATRVLADQGADVISIRHPAFPFLYPAIFEESYGKKQVVHSLKAEKSKAKFIEWIKTADVLVWGYGPGSLDRLGFDNETLMSLNPNLIVTRITAYGPEGPWNKRKGWEQLSQTCSGMVDLASRGRDQHHLVAALPCDYGTGYLAAIGTIAALKQRQEKGGFYEVEAMLTRTALEILALPHEAEDAVPVSQENDGKYFVDMDSDFGAVFTKLAPAAQLSATPSYSEFCPHVNGAHHPFKTTWDESYKGNGVPTHRSSEIMKDDLTGFLKGFGHEDIMLRKTP